MKSLYVIVSETTTRIGKMIRKIGNVKYNHAAIALDADLTEWYGFARKHHKAIMTARLVKENLCRYTLMETEYIDSEIFKIEVTDEQFEKAKNIIYNAYQDEELIYNYPCVITYPFLHGIKTYKSFTCVEFVVYLLSEIGIELFSRGQEKYTPDELADVLYMYTYFRGNLVDYIRERRPAVFDEEYFSPLSLRDAKESVVNTYRATKRTIYRRWL